MLERARLRWQCRRGMLELDILLNRFLDIGYENITRAEHETLVKLLDYPDQVLYDLLMENTVSTDDKIAALIKKIRTGHTI